MPVPGTLGGAHMHLEYPEWDISGLTFAGVTLGPNNLAGCRFADHGNYLVVGTDGGDIYRYPLSTPYNVATIQAYDKSYLNITTDWTRAIEFRYDGSEIWVGQDDIPNLRKHNMTVNWDISTISGGITASNVSDDIVGLSFSPDGNYLFIADKSGTNEVRRHRLDKSWNINTINPSDQAFAYTNIRGVRMHPSGKQMFIISEGTDDLRLYDLSTAWDLTTATLRTAKSLSAQTSNPMDVDISPDGKKIVTVAYSGNEINYYTA